MGQPDRVSRGSFPFFSALLTPSLPAQDHQPPQTYSEEGPHKIPQKRLRFYISRDSVSVGQQVGTQWVVGQRVLYDPEAKFLIRG